MLNTMKLQKIILGLSLISMASLCAETMDRDDFTTQIQPQPTKNNKKIAHACADGCCVTVCLTAGCALLTSLLEHPGYPNDYADCCTSVALTSLGSILTSISYFDARKREKSKEE